MPLLQRNLVLSKDSIVQFDIFTQEMTVSAADEYDAILVGGSGEYSVLDNHPTIVRFNNFVGELSTIGKPMFASCFGFQALALALGGTVVKDPDNAEVGSFTLETTSARRTIFCSVAYRISSLPNLGIKIKPLHYQIVRLIWLLVNVLLIKRSGLTGTKFLRLSFIPN